MSATKRFYFPEIYADFDALADQADPETEQEKAEAKRDELREDGIAV